MIFFSTTIAVCREDVRRYTKIRKNIKLHILCIFFYDFAHLHIYKYPSSISKDKLKNLKLASPSRLKMT